MDLGKGVGGFQSDGCDAPALSVVPNILSSNEFLAAALEQACVGTWHADLQAGVATIDRIASEICGISALQVPISELPLIHPEDRAKVKACLANGAYTQVEFRITRPDGDIRWLLAKGRRLGELECQSACYAGIVTDVTEQRLSEDNQRQAEERYRLISQVTTDVVFVWEVETDTITWGESKGAFFSGFEHNAATMDALRGNIHPNDRDRLNNEFMRLIETGAEIYESNHRVLSADGNYLEVHACGRILYDDAGKPLRLVGSFRDVSDAHRAHAALRESEAVNRGIVEASSDSVVLLGLDGKVLFLNRSGDLDTDEEKFKDHYGEDWLSLWPQHGKPQLIAAIKTAAAGGKTSFTDCFDLFGKLRWMDITVSPICDDAGVPIKLVLFARDVTRRREDEEKLRRAAMFDSLTNLPNRACFLDRLDQAAASTRKNGKRLGLLLLDVDDFKRVNDSLGHDAGDALLAAIASRLEISSTHSQALARVGGDEFAVLLEGIESVAELKAHAQAILDGMKAPIVYAGRALDCKFTIGAAVFPDDASTPNELLKSADIALYVGKANARGGLSTFEQKHRAEMRARAEMVSVARLALKESRILPFYQPKWVLRDRSIQGFEALLRWRDPVLGIQLPATIAAAFEDLDVATGISRTMMDLVIADMRDWLDQGVPFGHVAINAGAAEFRRDGFAEEVLTRLYAVQVPPRCLQLEVTETVFFGQGAEYVERALKLLDQEGVRIALDDFGTGYASLRHLKQFPVHVMKIDQGFVMGMESHAEDVAIISAVVDLGKRLGLDVIAEGIETEKQEARLRRLGCEFGQGFLYSPAVPAHAVPGLLDGATLRPKGASEKS